MIHGLRARTWDHAIRHDIPTLPLARVGWWGPWTTRTPSGWQIEASEPATAERLDALTARVIDAGNGRCGPIEAYRRHGCTDSELETLRSRIGVSAEIGFERLDGLAVAEEYRYRFSDRLFALLDGYSDLWTRVAAPFSDHIAFNEPVTRIDRSDREVTLHTPTGQISARTAIITVSVGVLRANAVEFVPELPLAKRQAISNLHMVPLLKAAGEFRTPFWESLGSEVLTIRLPGTAFDSWYIWSAYRPAPPTLAVMAAGTTASELSGDPERIAEAFLDPLTEAFPDVNIPSELVGYVSADWVADPWIRGGISRVPAGSYELRRALAEPCPPLFWAGEACAVDGNGNAQCVDGAGGHGA